MTARPRWRPLLLGGLAIAAADLVLFSTFWWPQGVSPDRIFRGVASGAFGPDARTGGLAMTLAGVFFHVLNATLFVVIYAQVARIAPALRRRAWLWGPPYGLLVWAGMTFVVVPLSRIGYHGLGRLDWLITSWVFHALVVGIGAAWFAGRAFEPRR